VADGPARRHFSKGSGAVDAEGLTDVDLEVGEEKGTSAVLVEVKAAPEVDQSGSMAVDNVDRWLRGCSGYQLGQEAAWRSEGGHDVLHPERKARRGREKKRGARR
jgi:hypothetical protein